MINKLAKQAYENSKSKGFYADYANLEVFLQRYQYETGYDVSEHLNYLKQANTAQKIALIQSEASEMLEADRKGKGCILKNEAVRDVFNIESDSEFREAFLEDIKDTKEDELADIIVRCLDYAGCQGMDLEAYVMAKMRYNSLRPYKHGKKY